ncbi:MAG: hypothetical protein H6603_06690 [Flavobacteriales bacterium]|nr:hypothetical protein [Flavobacteriales bacterium]MCB9190401.1 hypothetical protein [Flavobacteriales bacterium]MCB9204650.1 hypothetical protein [Flavobacteriales bacterium]
MKKSLVFLACLSFAACNQHNDIDECIETRIANFGPEICETGAWVKQYSFQGETTFAIHAGNCIADYHDLILDEECDTLGLIGGFGGSTEINGVDYYANATLKQTIWQN